MCFMVMSGAEAKVDSSLGVCCSSVLEASLINGLTVNSSSCADAGDLASARSQRIT
jgi:hypothetical protein